MHNLKAGITQVINRHDQRAADAWSASSVADDISVISTHFKILLGNVETENTIDICTHLDPTMDPGVWLSHFEVVVLPVLLRHNLL